MAEAPSLAGLHDDYEDQGFIVITLLGENMSGATPSNAELNEWASVSGADHPVVADPDLATTFRYVEGGSVGLPSMTLLAAGAEIIYADTWIGESEVQSNLP